MTRHPMRERGQAMTEFVVGAVFFLLPLFLIIPTLGKYADVKAASAQSARYVAWERTVWYGGGASTDSVWPGNNKSETEIQNEARTRVVAERAKITSADKSASSFGTSGARAIWHNRDQSAMLTAYSDAQTGAISNDAMPGVLGTVGTGLITAISTITMFDLEPKGFYTGKSAIAVKTLPIAGNLNGSSVGVFDPGTFGTGGKLIFRDQNVLLANGWSANGGGHVYNMTRGLTPLGVLADPTLKTVVEVAGCVLLAVFVPEICGLELSKIAPDVVPPDRLTGSAP